jgi:hypothetical protein
MKHIDLRQGWIKQLRDTSICHVEKVAGEENKADFFTKLGQEQLQGHRG